LVVLGFGRLLIVLGFRRLWGLIVWWRGRGRLWLLSFSVGLWLVSLFLAGFRVVPCQPRRCHSCAPPAGAG